MSDEIIYIRDWEIEVDKLAEILKCPETSLWEHSYKFVKWASEIQKMLNLKVYEP